MFIDTDVLINPEKYITVPPRLIGELDEQYKLRIMAFYDGYKSRQAEIDELQKRIDEMEKEKAEHIERMNKLLGV